MKLTIVIYDGFTTLDAVGGYEVLSRIPGMEVEFAAPKAGIIAADTRCLGLLAFRSFYEITETDILYVPGGPGGVAMESDEAFLEHIRKLDKTTTWTMSVCNGAAILAAAGLLRGRKATTNWFYQDRLAEYGAEFLPVRYHVDGKYLTTAGVSAGIDGALHLTELIAGEAIAKTLQLGIEYYPAPPFPEKTPAEAPEDAQALVRAFDEGGGDVLLAMPPVFTGTFAVVEREPAAEAARGAA